MQPSATSSPARSDHARRARRRRSARAAAGALATAALAFAPQALAAMPASVTTGGASAITYDSATLSGTVTPNGSETNYYFQYGPTKSYGGQSAILSAGAGNHELKVSIPLTGLSPLTYYHYRLVAVNGAGAAFGDDKTLLTGPVPLSLQILATPNPVLYAGAITVQGTLSGTDNGYQTVTLQATPFPFTGAFQNVGNPELTTATGSFSFPLLDMTSTTQFRVATLTNPPVVSPVVQTNVAVAVTSHVGRTRRAHYVRFYGTVTPAANGMQVGVLRYGSGHGVLVAGTILHPLNATSSSFSRVVRVTRGIYRVLVRDTSGAQVSSYGQPLLIE